MPYVSNQQRKWFHTLGAKKAGISEEQIKEFDKASKGLKLPRFAKLKEKVKRK